MKNFKTVSSVLIVTAFFVAACSSTDENSSLIQDDFLNIPDSHFETKLIEQGIDSDGIINQKLLKTDAEAITRLDLNLTSNFGEINDLTGIEGFVNLTLLSAARQEINDVNLSFNTKLDTLFLNGNHLTNIDISNNSNLILLDIQSNELSAISGLSRLTNLKKLNLSFNNFEDISIENESLEVLLISHNLLKTIDTNDALNLKNLLLILNQLTSVDFSSNALLETLVISGNKLQNINLENNTSLTHFYSSSNSLTSLDISNNSQLIDLRVDRNPSLTCIKILENQEISTVSLSDYQELNASCDL
ncbi:leucine-rich repeat domain-containing protein [Algibacter pacificus]|uniref:leucine-rich repeat domain-containing protein n=1 Tax=Algibacter pacificus TaxID=2599389 RepID=UPI0011C80537|nr:leucine-rich repeat domain-containing protein [Algibacter pacificus]